MKRVVSVSLGTSQRDKVYETTILGEDFRIERVGTDGSKPRFRAMMEELDGQVDALGIGGADLTVSTATKSYTFREIADLVRNVRQTPVVDGSGLKHTLERETIARLQHEGSIDFSQQRVLLVSAVDRFGMAQALDAACPNVVYGDILFGLGLPIPIRKYSTVQTLASILLPIVTQLPFQWFYPTGEKQTVRVPKHQKFFDEATVVCGDWHYIRRYMPDSMPGKTVLTQTLRSADFEFLAQAGVSQTITTTPNMGGESFATNVMEGVIVALLGKRPDQLSSAGYLDVLRDLDWSPTIKQLGAPSGTLPTEGF